MNRLRGMHGICLHPVAALYNQTGQADKALHVLRRRKFQPWEGGEGHEQANLRLGQQALENGHEQDAVTYFEAALQCPENLGEARHPLASASNIYYWLGLAYEALGERARARHSWKKASPTPSTFGDDIL